MVNPNAVEKSGDSNEQATQWDGIAEEMDRFDIEAAQQAVAARKQMEQSKSQYDALQKEITDAENPSGIYYADGLDAREIRRDTTKAEARKKEAGQEYGEAKKKYEALSTPEGREAMANQLREQAAEEARRGKYLEAGLRNGAILQEIQILQDRLNETQDSEARKHLEDAIAQQEEKAILIGKAMLENKAGQDENEEVVEGGENNAVKNEGIQEDIEEKEKTTPELKDLLERAKSFSERISEGTAKELMMDERTKIRFAIEKIDRLDKVRADSNNKLSSSDKKAYDKAMDLLTRSGYSQDGKNSRIFNILKNEREFSDAYRTGELGKERAVDYKLAELATKGRHKKDFKKAMKKEGLKMPKSWDDKNFTFDEMHKIASIAKDLYYE